MFKLRQRKSHIIRFGWYEIDKERKVKMNELILIGSGLFLSIATYKLGETNNRVKTHEYVKAALEEKNENKEIAYKIGWLEAISFMIDRM